MGNRCTICRHPERARVELGLANHVPVRTLSRKFQLSKDVLYRHRKGHMPPQLVASLLAAGKPSVIDLEALRESESEGLLQHLVAQRGRLYSLLDHAEEFGDVRAGAAVHGKLVRNLEVTGKLLGDLVTGDRIIHANIVVLPEYLEFRAALVRALRPFPEARRAVAEVLRKSEGGTAPLTFDGIAAKSQVFGAQPEAQA